MFMFRLTAIAAAVASSVIGAAAADLGAPLEAAPFVDEQRVFFGTGWYLRGDAGWVREKASLLTWSDGFGNQRAETSNGWTLGLGAGYKFTDFVRADVTYDVRNVLKDKGSPTTEYACPTAVNATSVNDAVVGMTPVYGVCREGGYASAKRSTLLANFYVDLGSWNSVTPYLGFGLGTTFGKSETNSDWYTVNDGARYNPTLTAPDGAPNVWVDAAGNPITPDPAILLGEQNKARSQSRQIYNLSWALMAGVAVDLDSHAKVDLGYRFVNMGRFGTGGSGRVNRAHEFRIGLRYMVD